MKMFPSSFICLFYMPSLPSGRDIKLMFTLSHTFLTSSLNHLSSLLLLNIFPHFLLFISLFSFIYFRIPLLPNLSFLTFHFFCPHFPFFLSLHSFFLSLPPIISLPSYQTSFLLVSDSSCFILAFFLLISPAQLFPNPSPFSFSLPLLPIPLSLRIPLVTL